MSRVVSIRLDEEDPDEGQALKILDAWKAKGRENREIITLALLVQADVPPVGKYDEAIDLLLGDFRTALNEKLQLEQPAQSVIAELRQALAEVQTIARTLQDIGLAADKSESPTASEPALNAAFMASVKKAARPGMRRES